MENNLQPFVPSSSCSPLSDGDHLVASTTGPHHHLTCLKLGKRPYYPAADDDAAGALVGAKLHGAVKRERASAVVPRCQVEGCYTSLMGAKDYHKRHKVCETHSKAPKVVVLGTEQRFCQQCSRFHVVSEFDEAKRSCRRRLAGHNKRRRKSSGNAMMSFGELIS